MSTCQNCGCKPKPYKCEQFGDDCVYPGCLVGSADFCGKKIWSEDPTYFSRRQRIEAMRAEIEAYDTAQSVSDAGDSNGEAS